LKLALAGDALDGQVSVGAQDEHQVLITDDPMDGVLSGFVWLDADNNGTRDAEVEAGIPGVRVTLSGTTALGQSLTLVAMTDDDGAYRFIDLPAGNYEVTEEHPSAFVDGQEQLGSCGGQVDEDGISQIELAPGQECSEYNFHERGFQLEFVSIRLLLASTPPTHVVLREWNARAAEIAGDPELAQAIRTASIPSVVRAHEAETRSATGPTGSSAPAEGEAPIPRTVPAAEGEAPDRTIDTVETSRHESDSTPGPPRGLSLARESTNDLRSPSRPHVPSRKSDERDSPNRIPAAMQTEPRATAAAQENDDIDFRAFSEHTLPDPLSHLDAVFAMENEWLSGPVAGAQGRV